MRTLMIAGVAMVTAVAATPADSQQTRGQHWSAGQAAMPQPRPAPQVQQMQQRPQMQHMQMQRHQQHWGGKVGGHWSGGMNAPGGWKAYRHPSRGWRLPRYWIAPSFFINDWADYGLSTPPQGYRWSRYYDDAVLMDDNGRVWDSVGGVNWDDGYGYDAGYEGAGYGAGYPPPGPGYAPPPLPYPPAPAYAAPQHVVVRGSYVSGGYWYPPVTTTTVTVQSVPVVTTTTSYITETRYAPARRVYRAPKHKWHSKLVRRSCTCSCGCQGS
jgi:Ni/Co efflux regulator RcnB